MHYLEPPDPVSLREAVFQSLGEASMCWVGGTGELEFDSAACAAVGNRLMAWLEWHHIDGDPRREAPRKEAPGVY